MVSSPRLTMNHANPTAIIAGAKIERLPVISATISMTVDDPPGARPTWVRRPAAPEATQAFLGAVRGELAERDVAGGHDPLVPGRRDGCRDPRLRGRLLPDGDRRRGAARDHRGRRGGRVLPGCGAFRAEVVPLSVEV